MTRLSRAAGQRSSCCTAALRWIAGINRLNHRYFHYAQASSDEALQALEVLHRGRARPRESSAGVAPDGGEGAGEERRQLTPEEVHEHVLRCVHVLRVHVLRCVHVPRCV